MIKIGDHRVEKVILIIIGQGQRVNNGKLNLIILALYNKMTLSDVCQVNYRVNDAIGAIILIHIRFRHLSCTIKNYNH